MRYNLLLFTILILIQCKPKSELDLKLYYKDNELSEHLLITPSGQYLIITIDSIGNILSISNDSLQNFQIVKYNSNKKVSNLFNYKDNKLDGRAYYFDEHSGYLSADFNYVNGTKSGNAVLYHDSTAMLKETMLYNDFGELYFREKYDRNGKVIGREGNDGMDTDK